ncbi:MAG TPA: hypothetical protein VKD90_23310 [Gemmataceae bacterium]|nr:hypothetical protein [Gemmataceae bacterium]
MFTSSARRLARRASLNLQELSARTVPAVIVTKLDLDGDDMADDIRITGDLGNNKVTIHDDGVGLLQVQIDANGDGDFADPKDLNAKFAFTKNSVVLELNLGAGNDSVQYVVDGNINMTGSARTVTANLGGGNDTFGWDMATHLIGNQSRVSLDIATGLGADTANVTFAAVDGSAVAVRTDLGAGIDTYDLAFGQIDHKASVDVDTDLGAGPNTHTATFLGVGKFEKAVMDMVIVGGNQKDTVTVHLNDDVGGGVFASRVGVSVDLLAGDDVFKGILDAGGAGVFLVDDHSQASIAVRGGAGNDNLSVSRDGTTLMRIDPDGLLDIGLDGGLGNDTVGVNFGGTDAWSLIGTMRVRLNGGFGSDALNCLLSNNASTTGVYDVAVRGGDGTDSVTFALNNNGGTPSFGPALGVILDGGTGTDALTNGTPQVTIKTAFETIA